MIEGVVSIEDLERERQLDPGLPSALVRTTDQRRIIVTAINATWIFARLEGSAQPLRWRHNGGFGDYRHSSLELVAAVPHLHPEAR